ncbi:MAG TPA: hypothetical protein PLU22_00300, partial [Polyangiaceae bacterium]|nr:hypothetical protein [Polyangiaceae bacterium]
MTPRSGAPGRQPRVAAGGLHNRKQIGRNRRLHADFLHIVLKLKHFFAADLRLERVERVEVAAVEQHFALGLLVGIPER